MLGLERALGLDANIGGLLVAERGEMRVEASEMKLRDLLVEMLRRENQLEHRAALQLELERRRHIHTYIGRSFSAGRLREALELLRDSMDFVPDVIILDRMEMEGFDPTIIEAAKKMAGDVGAEMWMACRTHRDGPEAIEGHLPAPADRFEDLVDTAFRLDPQDAKVRLHVAKDRNKMLAQDLNVVLDPRTLLLETGIGVKR